jgi:hypothetical protein
MVVTSPHPGVVDMLYAFSTLKVTEVEIFMNAINCPCVVSALLLRYWSFSDFEADAFLRNIKSDKTLFCSGGSPFEAAG